MATIRELTARLGIEVDITPTRRFDAAIDRSKKKLESLNNIKLDRFRRRVSKAFKNITKIGIAATTATVAKGFFQFTDVQQALLQLENQAGDSFGAIRNEIRKVLSDPITGKLTNELELLNGALAALELGLDPGVLTRVLQPALEFARVTRKGLPEVLTAISSFISDADLDLLIKLGELNQGQVELLKTAGVGLDKAGLIARTAKLEQIIAEQRGRTRQQLGRAVEGGAFLPTQLSNTFIEATKEIGETTLPLFRTVINGMIEQMDLFRKALKRANEESEKVGTFRAFFREFFTLPQGSQVLLPEFGGDPSQKKIKIDQEAVETNRRQIDFILKKFFPVFFDPEGVQKRLSEISQPRGSGLNQNTTNNQSNVTINADITIKSEAGGDPKMVARAVGTELKKVMGEAVDQSKRTTIIRGDN